MNEDKHYINYDETEIFKDFIEAHRNAIATEGLGSEEKVAVQLAVRDYVVEQCLEALAFYGNPYTYDGIIMIGGEDSLKMKISSDKDILEGGRSAYGKMAREVVFHLNGLSG